MDAPLEKCPICGGWKRKGFICKLPGHQALLKEKIRQLITPTPEALKKMKELGINDSC